LINKKKSEDSSRKANTKYILLLLLGFMFLTLSGLMDMIIMQNTDPGQVQFWYMLFATIMCMSYLLVKREKLEPKKLIKNYWVPLSALFLVIGDRALFTAAAIEESELSTMALIKQASVLITVIFGGLIFKEKHILYRLMCACIVLVGVSIVIML